MTHYRIFSPLRQKLARPGGLRWLGIGTLWLYRALTLVVLAAGFAFAGAVLALRYWILPNIEQYREDIARIVSERMGQQVTIGKISADWDGLRPRLVLERVAVLDAAGRRALEFSRVDNTLSWLSLPALELRFYALDIYRPALSVRRDARGVISIAGIELAGGGDRGGFAGWLLRQRDIEVHDATLSWTDEQRGAPPIELKDVNLQLFNSGSRHRFGLRATPPAALAAPLDLRGDLAGESVGALADWNGRLFLQLDYADIAAWRTWIPFPIEFPRGAGALRAWLTFSEDRLVEAVADVRLANVLTRLAPDLPELDLAELAGRLGWKQSAAGFEITTSRLGLTTAGGLTLNPTDFLLRYSGASGRRPAQGELRASALELAPLVALADRLPLGAETRRQLAEYSPKGTFYDTAVRWSGDWGNPQQYSVRGRFQNLSLNRVGRVPGFTGVSGSLEAVERGGTLILSARKSRVDMPLVFRDALEFDALTAQVAWSRSDGETEVRLNNVAFSNAHLAGAVFGIYRTAGSTRGSIDLTGSLTRADARFVGRYIPLTVGKSARDWLDAAFLAGQSNDVSLRLKGNLDDFPFPEGRDGVFQVAAKVTGGALRYAEGWPPIQNIAGDLVFRGRRMDVRARQGSVFGARLSRVNVEIPDLLSPAEVLNVSGQAEGPTADFLAFVERTPVLQLIDNFTEGWRAQGAGTLTLKLSLPLREAKKGKVAGSYRFANNTVAIAPRLPPVEKVGGRVDFTESSVRTQEMKGIVLGGPVTISAATGRDSAVRVDIQGRVNADAARRSAAAPAWAQRLRGTTDWRALITARRRDADILVESSLQGLAVNLPAPLMKTAKESLPVRFERRVLPSGQDQLSLSVGDILAAKLLRRAADGRTTITRGAVRLGGPAGEPDRDGVWVSGALGALEIDRWLALLGPDRADTQINWGGVDVKLGMADVMGRRFTGVAVTAVAQGGQWRGSVSGGELAGSFSWQPAGRGKLAARMKTLAVPGATPAAADTPDPASQAKREVELPDLDIVAEQFINKGRPLGRLEVSALSEGRDWRIERLRLANPESTFTLDGLWQVGPAQPRTQVNIQLEVSDIGKLLARLGYPEGVQRGTAKLEGSVAWAGAPFELDYSTLAGNVAVEAAKGQFVKLEPGIGKLLGILSLQSLPRRVNLDFRDVFSEGLAFDEIAGSARIDRGVARTENFRIQGPAARVTMSGEVDLARETQNLRVRVTPRVSDTLSIAGALVGGPAAGVAAFLAQKVLKDPFDQIIWFDYEVTGNWSDPQVKRVPKPAPEVTNQP